MTDDEDFTPRDPWLPTPTDVRDTVTEDCSEPLKIFVTPSEKEAYKTLARQSNQSVSGFLRPFLRGSIDTLVENNADLFDERHLNFFAARRADRNRQVHNRIDHFKERVDRTIQNRLRAGTPPRRIARIIDDFKRELEDSRDAGYIVDATYEEYLRYLHKQFSDYEAAHETSTANREDRSAAFAMSGPKYSDEFRDELGFAVGNIIRSCGSRSPTPDRAKFQRGVNQARQAARSAACPADMTERDLELAAKERAVEGDTLCEETALLDQAAQLFDEGRTRDALGLCQKAATVYPNDHGLDVDDMERRARSRADSPEVAADTKASEEAMSDERVEHALDAVELEADRTDTDATGEVASPADSLGSAPVADADGGRLDDDDTGASHDERQR